MGRGDEHERDRDDESEHREHSFCAAAQVAHERTAPPPPPPDPRRGSRRPSAPAPRAMSSGSLPRLVLIVVVAGVVISWGIVAAVHARDRFMVGWGEGAQMALGGTAAERVLSPHLF